jgi:spore coat protein JA
MMYFTHRKVYYPYHSPFDPCKPIHAKSYVTAPNLYVGYQPPNLPQFSPSEALIHGTLWPLLYDPYHGKLERTEGGQC